MTWTILIEGIRSPPGRGIVRRRPAHPDSDSAIANPDQEEPLRRRGGPGLATVLGARASATFDSGHRPSRPAAASP